MHPDREERSRDEIAAFNDIKAQLETRVDAERLCVEECHPGHGGILIVKTPNGQQTRDVRFTRPQDAQQLLSVPFEAYVFVGSYEAIASYSAGTVEVGIQIGGILNFTLKPIGGKPIGPPEQMRRAVEVYAPNSDLRITIGPRSDVWATLCWPASHASSYTVKVTGLSISQHDQALDVIEKLVLALLFQIDVLTAAHVDIMRYRDLLAERKADTARPGTLQFPDSEYDLAPLSLYRYGRAAESTPLVEFLAYYQVLEFYFSVYSQRDAQQRVQQVLKNPTFRVDRLADIDRVVDAVKSSAFESAASERTQLRATIEACTSLAELRTFLCEIDERKTFFSRKAKAELSNFRITVDGNSDIRQLAADRIYDIRCKIVHSKNAAGSRSEVTFLLPFSPEAAMLGHDIDLVRFIAQKVLIASSSPARP